MVVWFAANNHCAFALPSSLPAKAAAHHGMPAVCPMHAKQPGDQPQKQNGCLDLPCCNSLQAPAVASTKLIGPPLWAGLFVAFFTPAFNADDSDLVRVAFISDTGPPGESSFAELVLQRSILAHAPPVSLI
jgi:hypothetical protein